MCKGIIEALVDCGNAVIVALLAVAILICASPVIGILAVLAGNQWLMSNFPEVVALIVITVLGALCTLIGGVLGMKIIRI